MAFPNRDRDDNSWSVLPVTVWVDKAEEDIRRENLFFYDTVFERSFPYGDMGSRSTKLTVSVPEEGSLTRLNQEKFVDSDAYVKIRDGVLGEFEQGKGFVASIIMSISDEAVEWEGEPSSLQEDTYYIYEWWKIGRASCRERV